MKRQRQNRARLGKKSSVTKKIDRGKSVLTVGARQTRATRASTADQLPKQTESTAEPMTVRVRKTTKQDSQWLRMSKSFVRKWLRIPKTFIRKLR